LRRSMPARTSRRHGRRLVKRQSRRR
jgi:hypothetical protein